MKWVGAKGVVMEHLFLLLLVTACVFIEPLILPCIVVDVERLVLLLITAEGGSMDILIMMLQVGLGACHCIQWQRPTTGLPCRCCWAGRHCRTGRWLPPAGTRLPENDVLLGAPGSTALSGLTPPGTLLHH